MTDGTVGGPKGGCMLQVQRTDRTTLEVGVAGGALTEGLAERPTGDTGNVTGFAVIICEVVMVYMPIAGTVAEIVQHLIQVVLVGGSDLVALGAGRGVGAVAGGTVGGAKAFGVQHVQISARATQEAGVAGLALTERLAQWTAGSTTNMAGFAIWDGNGNPIGMVIMDGTTRATGEYMTFLTVGGEQNDGPVLVKTPLMTVITAWQSQVMVGCCDYPRGMAT